jgi:hypothetical protein
MAHRRLGGAVHIIPHPNLHFLYPKARLCRICQRLALNAEAALPEPERPYRIRSKGPETTLGISNLQPAVQVSSLIRHRLPHPPVCGRVPAVAAHVPAAIVDDQHPVCILPCVEYYRAYADLLIVGGEDGSSCVIG